MTDILDLPGWRVIAKRDEERETELEAEFIAEPDTCQRCGVIGRLYRHGTHATTYRDSPIRAHTVRILAQVRRYKCRDCGETFRQPLTGISENRHMTERCVDLIKRECLIDTFVRIADMIGCDDKTVRAIAAEHIAAVDNGYQPELPEFLGFDETQIDGKLRMVITDIGRRRPIEMLDERDKDTLATWLRRFKDRSMVKGIAIDMWRPYLNVSHELFPGVPVVIDKFHVVRMANSAMDDVRLLLAKTKPKPVGTDWMRRKALLRMRHKNLNEQGRFNLEMWLANEPEFAVAYHLKEAFYDIYDAPTKEIAGQRLDAWRASVPANMRGTAKKGFTPLLTATRNWREEILAFWDHPISNGYTEALNGVAKAINRAGRGYSFEVLRARLLFRTPGANHLGVFPWTPLVPHNGPGSPDPYKVRRCISCLGLYDKRVFQKARMPSMLEGGRSKLVLLCPHCRRRFHTE